MENSYISMNSIFHYSCYLFFIPQMKTYIKKFFLAFICMQHLYPIATGRIYSRENNILEMCVCVITDILVKMF